MQASKLPVFKTLIATTAAAFAVLPAVAAETVAVKNTADQVVLVKAEAVAYSDRARMAMWTDGKQRLEAALKPGQTKAAYMKALADNGYTLTSVNADKIDYVEYEVVQGTNSYEVQIDLDKAGRGETIKIESNIWRADATKSVLRGNRMDAMPVYVPANAAYSDRSRMTRWTGEKEKLEKALGTGKPLATYSATLRDLGYQITSTNEFDKDHVELEIVKGDSTYEVQIDLDNGGKATKVDVTTNMWQSDATARALEKNRQ